MIFQVIREKTATKKQSFNIVVIVGKQWSGWSSLWLLSMRASAAVLEIYAR